MTNRKVAGIIAVLWSAIFAKIETTYFGGNMFPGSLEEIICDSMALTVACVGCYFIITKTPKQ